MIASPVLEATELYRFYRVDDEETLALRGVSLALQAGEVLVVTGPSGSGKSTLLACLAGVDEPDGGSVRLDGHRLNHRSERERAAARASGIGMLFQSDNLLAHLTVADNIRLVQRLVGRTPRSTVAELLDSVALGHRGRSRPAQLSGGENARAGLAVATANDPRVLLADEPTGELDEHTESTILAVLRQTADAGCAVLIASHSPAVAASADRLLRMAHGRLSGQERR
ncbi:MAG: ABC transporter ATP-binding protein [Sciscionella sp.]